MNRQMRGSEIDTPPTRPSPASGGGNSWGTFSEVLRLEEHEATAGARRDPADGLRNGPGPAEPWGAGPGSGQPDRRAPQDRDRRHLGHDLAALPQPAIRDDRPAQRWPLDHAGRRAAV